MLLGAAFVVRFAEQEIFELSLVLHFLRVGGLLPEDDGRLLLVKAHPLSIAFELHPLTLIELALLLLFQGLLPTLGHRIFGLQELLHLLVRVVDRLVSADPVVVLC